MGNTEIKTTRIRPANPSDCRVIAEAIAESSAGYAQIGWQQKQEEYQDLDDLIDIGTQRYLEDNQPFTWRNAVIASQDDDTVGMMLSYGIDEVEPGLMDASDVFYPVAMELAHSWYICGMTVMPHWRGQGIGSEMLEFARELAADYDYPQLSLIALSENEGAVRLYQRHGFEVIERRPVVPHELLKYGGETLLMRLKL